LIDHHDTRSCFFFSSRRRHTRFSRDWSSDVCSSDLNQPAAASTPSRISTSNSHHQPARRDGVAAACLAAFGLSAGCLSAGFCSAAVDSGAGRLAGSAAALEGVLFSLLTLTYLLVAARPAAGIFYWFSLAANRPACVHHGRWPLPVPG